MKGCTRASDMTSESDRGSALRYREVINSVIWHVDFCGNLIMK